MAFTDSVSSAKNSVFLCIKKIGNTHNQANKNINEQTAALFHNKNLEVKFIDKNSSKPQFQERT